jgi:hypothetical protein
MTFTSDLHKPGSRSPIAHNVLLLVEGYDTFAIVMQLLRATGTERSIELRNAGGTDDLVKSLRLLPSLSGFAQVVALGVIRDCEANPNGAFESVQNALRSSGIPIPAVPREFASGNPQTGVYLLPDNDTPGMLETLLWRAISDHPSVPCIDDFLSCVTQKTGQPLANIDKSRVYAYIAAREQPQLLPGQAARAGFFPWDNPTFDDLKVFLRTLASKGTP